MHRDDRVLPAILSSAGGIRNNSPIAPGILTAEAIQASFRPLPRSRHSLLQSVTQDELYDSGNWMAPGGLLLANLVAEQLELRPGERVLDLGCGRGQSSVFLASQFGVEVVSLDLWENIRGRKRRASEASVESLVTPLRGDISRGLPLEFRDFDAIFCLQAFHCFGTKLSMLRYLASLLKADGRICFAQGCFKEEPGPLPSLFTDTDGWHVEYGNYHSPAWWRDHLQSSEQFDVQVAQEVLDGDVFWEDDVLYRGHRAGWSEDFLNRSNWLIRQIAHGQKHKPSLTHCILHAAKRDRKGISI